MVSTIENMKGEIMSEIDKIIDKECGKHDDGRYKDLAKAIEQYVIKARIEELEKANGKESLNMYHNGGFITKLEWIEHRLAELKKGIE